jgi:large subunit ribosomal protein L29
MSKSRAALEEMKLLGDAEMINRLGESRRELFNLRFQQATGQLDNLARLAAVKKEIARLQTLLREREIAAHEAQESAT